MANRIYGYARVSTREQNEDRQLEALTKFGVPEQNIITDKASGKDTEREGIEAAKKENVRFGPPSKLLPENWREVLAEVRCGNRKPAEAMRELGISRSCYHRLYNKLTPISREVTTDGKKR
ncbi:Resolvase, N terminal domain [Ruminococcus flavefaciens]|uniref:Resolvase, N terminal domain n=1 Tax=Ruminococcus flavefaciens TaxID=1265 RepID=A0A1H6IM67_RUMFL|nr:Resolvase, N terminal domain [Ruminococcus flavefaciens]